MGIRMLHRRTAPAQVCAEQRVFSLRAPAPAHSVGASTARIPQGLTARLRGACAALRRGELVLSYLALVLTLFPRSRPMPTMTVFVATEEAVSGGPGRRPPAERPVPEPGATA
ncbi:hypothetical protein AQJ54_11390 [Streptomyces griseorubiginosus]|uniref:Uncharacterized protein n=1 Tax=Streptomyces griseorubiginosus TaxID=67304 RepID=A0A101S6Q8_9ACTN|nr:hypothetical protein AQJ54_11390 [Streptomyces griseorubiginosus]